MSDSDDSTHITPAPTDEGTVPAARPDAPDADPLPDDAPGTVTVDPQAGAAPDEGTQARAQTASVKLNGLPVVPGYFVLREIARGGMGIVYRARDAAFDRDVAIKVMHAGQNAERFVVEAKVTAQLPHPGVPPVYALGELPDDGRPFLAMKLVEGRTLAVELKTSDLPRALGTFEHICLTVGFAHSRGIIHRDLKPANVMIGAFGETLVMDWGIAKSVSAILEEGGDPGDTLPSTSDHGFETVGGKVKGTPAYMAPEQARGEPVDARADVFALGGILAVMLTGKPPFTGDTAFATVQKAAKAKLDDCFAQLDACSADAEIVRIAKKCLAARAADRYGDGEEVAAYRAGVENRLRKAERDGAVSAAEAREQKKRRKVQLALAVSVLVLVTGAGTVAWWQAKQETERKIERERDDANQRVAQARLDKERELKVEQARKGVKLAADLRKAYKFREAGAALAQAAQLADDGAPDLLAEVKQAQSDLAFVVQLDDIRYRKWLWIAEPGGKGHSNTLIAAPEYRKAFAARGLDLERLDPTEAAKRIAASEVRADLVAAVDDWALSEQDDRLRHHLLDVARRADPEPWFERLRDPAVLRDKAAVAKLAAEADPTAAPASVCALAVLMNAHRLSPVALLTAARVRHPADFELAFVLAQWHAENGTTGEQIAPYEAARAIRPDNVVVLNNLGAALYLKGDLGGAIATYREALKRDPSDTKTHSNLGLALFDAGDVDGAIAAYREALKHDPKHARAYNNLGIALRRKGDSAGGVASYREAIKHDPKDALGHYNLGNALSDANDGPGAIASYKEAVKCDPKFAKAHSSLGVALYVAGDADGAIASYREALKHDPRDTKALTNLGAALHDRGDLDGAIALYKEALKYAPTLAQAHYNLGNVLRDGGNAHGAVAAYKEAAKHDPNDPLAPTNCGVIYFQLNNYPEAIVWARAGIRADPKFANAHALLGLSLQKTGDLFGARAALTEAARLDKRFALNLATLPRVTTAPAPREVKP